MDNAELVEHFRVKCFNAQNFLFVFEHLDHFLNVDGSTDLGYYYMSSKLLFSDI